MDDPLCNVPTSSAAPSVHATTSTTVSNGPTDAVHTTDAWRLCRRDSFKLQRLLDANVYGGGALHTAAMDGHSDVVAWLMAEGRDVNARGNSDATALHVAALSDNATEALHLLLASGADPNAVDAFGFTPLHRAIERGSLEAATLLLSGGANVTLAAPGVRPM
ncbi:hypothetical protein PINS_up011202 [Pythium insidiosum]|nr:hypothetical protein PINS_up011202 [Pythium insidiosum]